MVTTVVVGNNRLHLPSVYSPNHKFILTKQPQFLCSPIHAFPSLPCLDFSPDTIYLVYFERPQKITFHSYCEYVRKEVFSFEKKLNDNTGAGKIAIRKSIHVFLPQCYFNSPVDINNFTIYQTLEIETKIYLLQKALLTRNISSTILPTKGIIDHLDIGVIFTQMCFVVDEYVNSLTLDARTY